MGCRMPRWAMSCAVFSITSNGRSLRKLSTTVGARASWLRAGFGKKTSSEGHFLCRSTWPGPQGSERTKTQKKTPGNKHFRGLFPVLSPDVIWDVLGRA
jgi:hypothetical protein